MAENDDNDDDMLVRRRARRSTAGNRMEAALAEFATLNAEPEVELDDDIDFVGPDDEDEVFDSDFQSTDEEVMQEDEAAGEKEIAEEEKQARRSARQRVAKAVEISTVLQRAKAPGSSLKKEMISDSVTKTKPRTTRVARHVSMGGAVDAETGETVKKRKSRRQSTMLSSQILHSRLKDAKERKASTPKRSKEIAHTYTQAELIARALDTEEGNIIEHRNYLVQEEEKRRRARVVRQSLAGPILRWVSRTESEKVLVERPPLPTSTPYNFGVGGYIGSGYGFQTSAQGTSGSASGYSTYQPYGTAPLSSSYLVPPVPEVAAPPQYRLEKVTKNYLVHELDQREGVPKPRWSEMMSTVFGTHIDWEEVKVYSGKHRPLSRPVTKCPLTGRPAIYRDPRSGVPFANVGAFKTLTRILSHDYIWNEELKCYTAEKAPG